MIQIRNFYRRRQRAPAATRARSRFGALPPSMLVLLPLLAACSVQDNHPVTVIPQVVPAELYVAPDGLDSNPGTRAAPLRTLARAAQVVQPGTIVNVLPGVYHGGFRTAVSGLSNARIVFRSSERWGARIVPPPLSSNAAAWDNRASYVDIEGFEIDGSAQASGTGMEIGIGAGNAASTGMKWTTGIYSGGSYNRITGNHVHHVANSIACTSSDGGGIGVDSYYKGMHSEVSGNSVHDIGPPDCRYVHGIYMNAPGTIRNNVVYRVAEAGILLWHDAHRVSIVNNTVTASNRGILVGGGDFYHTKGLNDHTQVINNIVYDNRFGIAELGATGPHNSYRNNLVFQNPGGDWSLAQGMSHSGTVAAAPNFITYTRSGTPDFRLAQRSPAIGKGLDLGADQPDFYGKARPNAVEVDIGAAQH
ncbi:DUF1565 domain-containing protein [Massilia forsythiae]|uniref:DUF1565 domain-containing protein n=1 Tax=Massilia forsythiae TaxID=2728020 RepID=A0A7Z2W0A9_9BURK|nr:right-handed parallel beta-helix repeat-containing protein [Massilia forsythiae]QJE02702.1 DUF1565 domain-containing protein [Massilia forsythiae]